MSLNLLVNPIQSYILNQQICEKDTFLGYFNTGTYIDTFINQYSCDSIRKINLTVKPLSYKTINKEICFGDTYLGYSNSGTYIDTFQNALGCDSIRNINLTVLPFSDSTYSISICENESYLGYSATGIYIDTFLNAKGCDSVRKLFLYVKPTTYLTINKNICEGEYYLGYHLSGLYIDTFVNAQSCDSIRYLNLNVIKQFVSDTIIELCVGKGYYAQGMMQTTNGNYTDTFLNINNCDSIVNTKLVFKQKLHPRISGDSLLCVGDSSILYVGNFSQYAWSNADTTRYIIVKSGGEYSVIVKDKDGCVGKDTMEIIMNPLPNVSIQFTQKDLCKYDTIQLSAIGAQNYAWYSPNMTRLISIKSTINFSIYANPVNIFVKGEDENICSNYDSITLYYINCCGNIYIPNAFSPNGDGHNDKFKPVFSQVKYEGTILKNK